MVTVDASLELPPTPADLVGVAVAAWREPVIIETYLPEPPDRYPAYLDNRVYQGSSGRVYPLPFHDRIAQQPAPHRWDAVHIENPWLRLMILPELGGRIHLAYDKTTGRDLFYRNPVIKPALVGLAGPWLAGGIEFNWPQHHRPATFLPTLSTIEYEADGAVTVWCSDHDPFARMKGMHGVRLRPDRAVIELRVRLYNRSEQTQTFLWWANVAAKVDADYQSFFPDDVHVVADHAKRAVTTFPAADGPYYGVDYPSRRGLTTQPGSDRSVPGDRIDWYRNIPVPTSYMCLDSRGDFFGGYDHRAGAGFVHWADHHYAVGKKQWTWGNAPFGDAWGANLADDGSAYIELMAGVFTDNQPDFSFLAPGETKAFSQFWYPLNDTGPVHAATLDAAVRVTVERGATTTARVVVQATRSLAGAELLLTADGHGSLGHHVLDLEPAVGRSVTFGLPDPAAAGSLRLEVRHDGHALVTWSTPVAAAETASHPASEPAAPASIATAEELHLTGVHLQQYRHATRSPEPYWYEALRRDPEHVGAHTALAARRYDQGRFAAAEQHLRAAVRRLTALNPNPADAEPHYRLGLVLIRLGRDDAAYDALAKASWVRAWRPQATFQLARIDARNGRDHEALHRIEDTLSVEPEHLQAQNLRTVLLRRLGRTDDGQRQLEATLRLDPLDAWALTLTAVSHPVPDALDAQTLIDVALEDAAVGEIARALTLLDLAVDRDADRALGQPACAVTARYHRAALLDRTGDAEGAAAARAEARRLPNDWNFPGRLDDALALTAAIEAEAGDARAHGLLGHWLYARERREDALTAWQRSAELDAGDPVVWRNIAVAAFNLHGDAGAAADAYDRALRLAPDHARLHYERDQLAKRSGEPVRTRLDRLRANLGAVGRRDDLSVEYAALLIADHRPHEALDVLAARHFQPWEGGEGLVLRAWERAQLALARRALEAGDTTATLAHAEAAIDTPAHLGECRHELANPAELMLVLGDALQLAGRSEQAAKAWRRAADAVGDFQGMAPQPYSENTAYSVIACRRLARHDRAEHLITGLAEHTDTLARTPATIDYFATSLPSLLLFTDDPQRHRDAQVELLRAQLAYLTGGPSQARERADRLLAADPAHEAGLDLRAWLTHQPDAASGVSSPGPSAVLPAALSRSRSSRSVS